MPTTNNPICPVCGSGNVSSTLSQYEYLHCDSCGVFFIDDDCDNTDIPETTAKPMFPPLSKERSKREIINLTMSHRLKLNIKRKKMLTYAQTVFCENAIKCSMVMSDNYIDHWYNTNKDKLIEMAVPSHRKLFK